MSAGQHRRLLAIFSILIAAWSPRLGAQDADGDASTRARSHISEAEELKREGELEPAAAALRRALAQVAQLKKPSDRRTLQKKIENLLKSIDPRHASAGRSCAAASRALALAAEADIKRGWLRYARRLTDAAHRIVPGSAAEQRQALIAADQAGARDATSSTRGGSLFERWFREHDQPMGESGWTVSADRATSPPTRGRSIMIASSKSLDAKRYTLKVAVRATAAPGKFAVVFGLTEELQYHLLELRSDLGFAELRLFRWDGRQMHEFGSQLVTLTRAERSGWLPLTIEVDGQKVRGIVGDGIEEVRGTTRADKIAGKIGLFVSGDSRHEKPIDFRLTDVETGRD